METPPLPVLGIAKTNHRSGGQTVWTRKNKSRSGSGREVRRRHPLGKCLTGPFKPPLKLVLGDDVKWQGIG